MVSNIETVQESVLTAVRTLMSAYDVYEQGVPDIETLERDSSGAVKTYICIQFGANQPGRGKSMIGPRGDDYIVPVYLQIVGPVATNVRKSANYLFDGLLGASIEKASELRPRLGGQQIPITSSTGATEAYMWPMSFGVVTTAV